MTSTTGVIAMTAKELTQIILTKEKIFILDVRNESDFNDWRIEGENTETINIPYFQLLDGVESIMEKVPVGRTLLVVCAKEGSSKYVAEQMLDAGISQVYYLQGGMKSWNEYLQPVKIGDLKQGGAIYQFVRLGKGCLSYMIMSEGEAAVIDALRMTEIFVQFAEESGVQIKHVLDTHLHADHISGGRKLAEETRATYWLPPKDADEVVFPYAKLEEGNNITIGSTAIYMEPIYSPGHTKGSTSFIVDKQYLLTGDILFIESIGRPDLAGKADDWVGDLRTSLYHRYKQLAQDLIVLPAHFGKITELGEGGKVMAQLSELYRNNAGLNIDSEEIFRIAVSENLPSQPHAYQEIRRMNMGKITTSKEEQRDMEMGPNRCAVHDN
ncbi:glyoxylase-like metal-dependent hydrolase (beta-lactamase superfamily II) [Paenibacillus shirakamiensis]|uniref:Glyoxylase-like metal-dependent hydrolase (Beta-lactamase superfamily II) n=1 Tax=Paenibacillus shirakamiensis TaxID=1265935 RepID=A0ABS4JEM6_9BACL|nr:MBL fold metallo-hydrolase [Paenibacillus shirakamiensis]MBP2000145.1 glyoxylase-like metal-dependent hydrolase (beta-lactamase superfamily II) [Paenibacillus shirakamiensis]